MRLAVDAFRRHLLYLWIFGNLEDAMDISVFYLFYLLCGALSWLIVGYSSFLRGASGAIAGVLGGYVLMLPEQVRVASVIGHHRPARDHRDWFCGAPAIS